MSTSNRALVLENFEEDLIDLNETIDTKQLTLVNCATETQPKTVKVSGTITVSF